MNVWKVCGVAGLAGVAAAGVIIARDKRQRTQLTPEEIRTRLLERFAQAGPATVDDISAGAEGRWGSGWREAIRPGSRR